MLNMEPQPDVLNLLKKLQESTTEDIDEERGSFKKGDTVIYDMLGVGLTNSDLIRTLGVDEHAMRANHNETVAEIVEAIGEEVARYSIMFKDGFVINDVAASELKSVNEGEAGDLVDILTAKQGPMVADQLQNILRIRDERGVIEGIHIDDLVSEGKLNVNALRIIYKFLKTRTGDTAAEVVEAIEDWVDMGYGDPSVLEFKTNEDRYVCVRCGSRNVAEVGGKVKCLKCGHVEDIKPGETLNIPHKGRESKTNEAEEATDTMQPQEKPDINAEDYHMEDYSDEDLNKPEAKVKSKSEETGDVIRQVEDDELEQKQDKVVTPKKESKIKEQEESEWGTEEGTFTPKAKCEIKKLLAKYDLKVSDSNLQDAFNELTDDAFQITCDALDYGSEEDKKKAIVWIADLSDAMEESKLKEQKHPSDNLTIGDTVKVLRGRYKGEVGEINDVMSPEEDPEEMPEGQFDVKMSDGKMIYLGWDDVELVEAKLKEEETEITPSREGMKKISDEKLKELHRNALRSLKHWEKDKTAPEKVELTRKAVARYEEAMVDRGLLSKDTKESKFSFMKKQKPLWLCNECFKTFRSDKSVCTSCKSKEVEKITEQHGPGFTKEVFQVTWKNTDTGKEESTRVMAFDKADAKKEAARPSREITKVEGPITEEPRREEAKVPFDQKRERKVNEDVKVGDMVSIEDLEDNVLVPVSKVTSVRDDIWRGSTYQVVKTEKSDEEYHGATYLFVKESKLHEDVQELVREVPGIDKEEREILLKAIEDGVISNEWPTDEEMVDALTKAGVDPVIASDLEAEDFKVSYIKHFLLTKAMKAARAAKESKLKEQEDWDISFMYSHNLIWHNPMVDREGEYYHWQKSPIRGKRIRVFTDYQAEWVERNKGIPVMAEFEDTVKEAKKEVPTSTAIEIVRSTVDPDAWIFRAVELPSGDSVNLSTSEGSEKEVLKKGKEIARGLGAEFLGIVDDTKKDESKLKEQEKNIFKMSDEELEKLPLHVLGKAREDAWRNYRLGSGSKGGLDWREGWSRLDKIMKKMGESKLKEQEEDTFGTIAKGMVDKVDADKLARDKGGQVVTDEEDEKKFAVIVREE